MSDDSLQLLERYRGGDQQAASELFRRYVDRLVRLADRRLSSKLARRVDPEDVVQSAFRSFFGKAQEGRYTFNQSGELWGLLAAITSNKVRQKVEHHSAQKRNYKAEQSPQPDASGACFEVMGREPDSVDAAVLVEEVEYLTRDLDDLRKQMIDMRLQGYLIEEIALEVNRSERTVRRVLEYAKNRLAERLRLENK